MTRDEGLNWFGRRSRQPLDVVRHEIEEAVARGRLESRQHVDDRRRKTGVPQTGFELLDRQRRVPDRSAGNARQHVGNLRMGHRRRPRRMKRSAFVPAGREEPGCSCRNVVAHDPCRWRAVHGGIRARLECGVDAVQQEIGVRPHAQKRPRHA